ncbi:LysE family translocator [Mangrovicoccus sp. HB161399]|uniref:LysE family translocator n=1 Tax=Mangrovicoccus sp. HB161399 TaxID=2720392 RepID=UPI0020A64027|nr:LysE family translocator [Mangrovicoccus sp. HB161399]
MMPDFDAIIAVTLAGFALSLTPGPSMLYVLSRSVGQSRSAGLASAVGLGFGGILLVLGTSFGLAALFERIDWVVPVLSYVGSAYLVWLGIGMIHGARDRARQTVYVDTVTKEPISEIVWQGILVELLNPKTVLFLVLFLPPFVSSDVELFSDQNGQLQLLVLGSLVPLTALPSDLAVALLGGTLARTINCRSKLREYSAYGCGLVLVAIALHLQM